MNGAINRKLLFVLGPVTGVVMFVAVVMIATFLTNREYRDPYRAPAATVDAAPSASNATARKTLTTRGIAGWRRLPFRFSRSGAGAG